MGIIPANTGRICGGVVTLVSATDHPREYGENRCSQRRSSRRAGSSPRIRGEWGGVLSLISSSTDHPREYGENLTSSAARSAPLGSSPRIRGEYGKVSATGTVKGIIPANTGRINQDRLIRQIQWDHPREYGENARQTAGKS